MVSEISKAYRAAFPVCLPIITSFLALGISCGLFVTANGFPDWYAPLMSIVIFGGSMEFVTVTLLLGTFAPVETIIMAFMIQSRHLFYGIAMLKKYDMKGWKKAYLIYSLCDESFSVNHTVDAPEGVDRTWFMIAVSSLNQASWILGTALGGIIGTLIPFDTAALGFVMTALFTIILIEEMLKEKKQYPALIGFFASVVCLLAFGSQSFLVPTLIFMVFLLIAFRKPIEGGHR